VQFEDTDESYEVILGDLAPVCSDLEEIATLAEEAVERR
jgi:hypothetical protein